MEKLYFVKFERYGTTSIERACAEYAAREYHNKLIRHSEIESMILKLKRIAEDIKAQRPHLNGVQIIERDAPVYGKQIIIRNENCKYGGTLISLTETNFVYPTQPSYGRD